MTTLCRFQLSPVSRRTRVFGAIASALLISVSSTALLAQNTPAAGDDANRRRRAGTADENNGGRRGFNPEDVQARMLSSLRERLEITDDEEWKLISERIAKVTELRRTTLAGAPGALAAFAGRGAQAGGDNKRGGRGPSPAGGAELTALQTAVRDKLPDAEIKSRLDRLRESRRENEARLSKAQEELRAVLSVRQEAVAVVFGLLP